MFGRSEAEREEEARGGNIRDVEAYFKQVQSVIKRYRRVVEKLELRNEGLAERYLEINGVWEDHFRYAITAEEWADRRDELVTSWLM